MADDITTRHSASTLINMGGGAGSSGSQISLSRDTEFDPAKPYFKVYVPRGDAYTVETSGPESARTHSDIPETISDTLQFSNDASARLGQYPVAVDSWRWIGNQGPAPKFDGENITLSSPFLGVLEISYITMFDRWRLASLDYLVNVVGTNGDAQADLLMDPADASDVEDVTLRVVCHCTGDPLHGVSVWVSGRYRGTTRQDGTLYLGLMGAGRYALMMTKPGYLASQQDGLVNDWLTVSGSTSTGGTVYV